MCPWRVEAIQKSGLSKHFVDSKKSTVSDSIGKLYLDDPYNKMLTILSSQWFNKVLSILLKFSGVSFNASSNINEVIRE